MFRPRIIPVLLLRNLGLVKSIGFKKHKYIGDPINAVRIFNDMKADELVFLDIDATREKRLISLDFVRDVGEEANMPFAVGGGIRSLENIRSIISAGAEKVVIGSYAIENPEFVKNAANTFGSSTIVVCMDVKNNFWGKPGVFSKNGSTPSQYSPVDFARLMEDKGIGEIIVQSVERDGKMNGYDITLINEISRSVNVPVVALGGAGNLMHLRQGYIDGHSTGLAAGSMFVYQGTLKGVLINYPDREEIKTLFRE